MTFFKKLRDKMFRSSDKITEGLDALVIPAEEPVAKPGILGRMMGQQPEAAKRLFDDAMLENLEELLIEEIGRAHV